MSPVASTPLELDVTVMTCACCAARIKRRLTKLPGASATVDYATEKASVTLPPSLPIADAIAAVEAVGYGTHPAAEP